MKTLLRVLFCLALGVAQAPAHAQPYDQAQLEALLAPVALYPDPALSQILMAATFPEQVMEAAQWSRANPQLSGEDAVRAVQGYPWDPSVKSLVAFPDLLARMAESPQWTSDLGNAYLTQEPQVMDTVQLLRQRAYASGYLRSDNQQYVTQQGDAIVVQPAAPQVVYLPYYDPLIVYGPWWVPYRPVYWRPWYARPAFVSATFFYSTCDWHHRHVAIIRQPTFVNVTNVQVQNVQVQRWRNGPPSPAAQIQAAHSAAFIARSREPLSRPFVNVPESQRQPIINGAQRALTPVPGSQRQPIIQSAPRANWHSNFRRDAPARQVAQERASRPSPMQSAPHANWRPDFRHSAPSANAIAARPHGGPSAPARLGAFKQSHGHGGRRG